MKSQELLQLIYRNAKMRRDGLDHLIEKTEDRSLRRTMARHFAEYQKVMNEAKDKLEVYGEKPEGSSMDRTSSHWMSDVQVEMDDSSAKMAETIIEGSNLGVIRLTRELHNYEDVDDETKTLAEKLLRTEKANIEEMRAFL